MDAPAWGKGVTSTMSLRLTTSSSAFCYTTFVSIFINAID